MKNIFYVLVSSLFLIQGCSKNNEPIGITPINTLDTITNFKGILFANEGKLTLNFEHYFKNNPLVYATQNYITNQNDTIQINSLSYRISNVQLFNSLQSKWVDIGTYKLNNGEDAFKYTIAIDKVPAGLYSNLRFNIGVDSLRNHSGDQSGDLDPALGMYWSWTNGYIHYKIEGRFASELSTFSIHIGGSSNVVNKLIDLTNYAVKNKTNGMNFLLKLDVNIFFSSPNPYSLITDPKDIHSENIPEIKTKLLPNLQNTISLTDITSQ